ncbi:MAG: proton-conducting transporter membrane subunit [Planctomycetaceae bacterium]
MWDTLIRPIREHLPLWLVVLPFFTALLLGCVRLAGAEGVRRAMLVHLLLSVALSVWLVAAYEPVRSPEQAARLGPLEQFQFRDRFAWLGESRPVLLEQFNRLGERRVIEVSAQWGPDIRFAVGVDGLSVWFVALSVLLIAVAGSSEFGSRKSEVTDPQFARGDPPSPLPWLCLQSSLVGTFIALDVVLFVVCWMSTFLSVAWLMGGGGDSQRHDVTPRLLQASLFSGGLVGLGLGGLVLALSWLWPSPNQVAAPLVFSIPELVRGIRQVTASGEQAHLWGAVNIWLFLLLVVGCTWPLGLAPLHRRFVEAFASAPRGVAIVLAGVLFKVGVYGWLRFVVPLFPDQLREHADSFTTLLGLSSLIAAALAFGERDWNRRIALATSSSIGLSLIGVLSLALEGLTGGVLRVLSHGLTAGLLVWLLPRSPSSKAGLTATPSACARRGVNRENAHADGVGVKQANETSFPASVIPSGLDLDRTCKPGASARRLLVRFALFAWIGLPGLSGFVAEFVTPFGLFQHAFNAAALSLMTSGLIAWMWVRADREPANWSGECWSRREVFVAASLVILNVALGVAPQFVVTQLQPSLISLLPVDH